MNYCPRCGSELVMRLDGGRDRPACAKDGCGFVHFGHHSIGCGGVVIRDNKALLVQRGINPNRGAWQIPGGYVESDEEILSAVEREALRPLRGHTTVRSSCLAKMVIPMLSIPSTTCRTSAKCCSV